MKRFTGHLEPWGEFVDAKINAPELLSKEILKKKVGTVWVSRVCDPYQPLEAKYQLTRQGLAIPARYNWPVFVQTRSPARLINRRPSYPPGTSPATSSLSSLVNIACKLSRITGLKPIIQTPGFSNARCSIAIVFTLLDTL